MTMGCLLAACGLVPASADARTIFQTNWNVVQASGKIVWTLESVPFDYLGFRTAGGEITELWHYLGHGPEVSFPFTTLRPLAPPGSPVMSFAIRPIKGTLGGRASGTLTDGTTGGCSANLANLPNNFGKNATLNEATIDRRHLALWVTAEPPTDLLTTDPCATALGPLGDFPAADPDQQHKPTVQKTPVSTLRLDPVVRKNRGKLVVLHLKAQFNLVVTTTDGKRHVVGTETTTATVKLKLKSGN
jgi:hypothetical protein